MTTPEFSFWAFIFVTPNGRPRRQADARRAGRRAARAVVLYDMGECVGVIPVLKSAL